MTKKNEETAVAVPVSGVGGVPVVGSDLFNMGDQMEGVEAKLPQIKIVHRAEMFDFPDGPKQEAFSDIDASLNPLAGHHLEADCVRKLRLPIP